MKKIFKGLTFKIFIIIFMSFILIATVSFKKDYDTKVGEMIKLFESERAKLLTSIWQKSFSGRDGYYSTNDEIFKKDYDMIYGDGWIGLMDKNYQISLFHDTSNPRNTLEINNNEDKYFDVIIDISKLTDEQIDKIKNTIITNHSVQIYYSGEIKEIQTITNEGQYDEKVSYDEMCYLYPSFLQVGDDIYIGKKEKNATVGQVNKLTTEKETIYLTLDENGKEVEYIQNIEYEKKMIEKILENKFKNVKWYENGFYGYDEKDYNSINEYVKKMITNNERFYKLSGTYTDLSGNTCFIFIYDLNMKTDAKYLVQFLPYENFALFNIINVLKNSMGEYIVFIFFMILLALLISYMITKRIKNIDKVTCLIADNDFNIELSEKGEDELSSLSKHINMMSKSLKQNIEGLNKEIEHVKKLENLRKEFIAKFTHEIKTPLAVINGNLELLEVSEDEVKKEQYINNIDRSVEQINSLILQMLDLSKLEANAVKLEKTNFVLEELVMDIIDNNESLLLKKQLKVNLNVEKDVELNADKDRIGEVIHNYFINAIKHSEEKSVIRININEHELSVYNIGTNIDEKIINDIWLSFVSNSQNGTGLGLAISKNILELHGFKYGVRNKKEGVEFYFQY